MAWAIPTIGTLALLFFSIGCALVECFYNGTCSFKEFFQAIGFIHFTVYLFNIPVIVWIPTALAAYGVGVWLVLSSEHRSHRATFLIFGLLLSLFPSLLIALAPLSEYRGP